MKPENIEKFKDILQIWTYRPYTRKGNQLQALEKACYESIKGEGGALFYYESFRDPLIEVIGELYLNRKILDQVHYLTEDPEQLLRTHIENQGVNMIFMRNGKKYRAKGKDSYSEKEIYSRYEFGAEQTISGDPPTPEEIKKQFLTKRLGNLVEWQLRRLRSQDPSSFYIHEVRDIIRNLYNIESDGQVISSPATIHNFLNRTVAYTNKKSGRKFVEIFFQKKPRVVKRLIVTVKTEILDNLLTHHVRNYDY